MKPTLMNVHICSMDKVNKSLMLSVFLAYKLRHGFIQCSKEKAEQTYQLDFERSDVCSWLSLSGSHWHDDLFEGANEHLGLVQDMGMSAVYFNVNPDGSAFFELADPFNHCARLLTTGDDVPERYPDVDPFSKANQSKEYWEEFTGALASQAEFEDAMKVKYSSAEKTASALSPLLRIRRDKLLIDAKYGNTTENMMFMHFKAVPTDTKKLTIKAAFKKIYGEALKPLGFVWAKTKEPCFIRVIDNELIHIIGINDKKPDFIVPFGGVLTLYRADLMLNKTYRDMSSFLPIISQFYLTTHTDSDEAPDPRLYAKFKYLISSAYSIQHTMSAALVASERWILPLLDTVQSIQDFPAYFQTIHHGNNLGISKLPLTSRSSGNFQDDYVVSYLLPNPLTYAKQFFADAEVKFQAKITENPESYPPENIKYLEDRHKRRKEEILTSVRSFVENQEVKQQTMNELERRKRVNLDLLHTYGVI